METQINKEIFAMYKTLFSDIPKELKLITTDNFRAEMTIEELYLAIATNLHAICTNLENKCMYTSTMINIDRASIQYIPFECVNTSAIKDYNEILDSMIAEDKKSSKVEEDILAPITKLKTVSIDDNENKAVKQVSDKNIKTINIQPKNPNRGDEFDYPRNNYNDKLDAKDFDKQKGGNPDLSYEKYMKYKKKYLGLKSSLLK